MNGLESARTAAEEASTYFNSLPLEQRRKLSPLLDDYRRRGIDEALAEIASVARSLAERSRSFGSVNWNQL